MYSWHNYEYTISKNYCFQKTASSNTIWIDTWSWQHTISQYTLYCYESWTNVKIGNTSTSNLSVYIYDMNSIVDYWIEIWTWQCQICEEQYTSLECQTEYNLIPVESVTANYCTSNFDLISPSDCPISSWTWDTQRSALYLNNVQYAGASNIYLNISDFLDYSIAYIDSGSSFVLDVDWYVADTWYLNDILTVQEYHPNSEDFTTAFVSVLTLWLPYVVVALFVLLVRKLVKKIFKS